MGGGGGGGGGGEEEVRKIRMGWGGRGEKIETNFLIH